MRLATDWKMKRFMFVAVYVICRICREINQARRYHRMHDAFLRLICRADT